MHILQAQTARYLTRLVDTVQPNLVLLLGQPYWIASLLKALQPYRDRLKVINYTPIEGKLIKQESLTPLRFVDHCILYTEFSRQNLHQLGTQRKQHDPDFLLPTLHVLPHGVDTQKFHPYYSTSKAAFNNDKRIALRRLIFPDNPELKDAFIVLNANLPYFRKRIDITLEGFKRFAQGKPANVYLYLHQINLDSYTLRKLRALAEQLGMTQRLLFNLLNPTSKPISDQQLNLLYNACDIGINTAMAEGWGLVSFEHAATGKPQIVPNHTGLSELWQGAASFLEPIERGYLWYEQSETYIVSPEDVANRLEQLYTDPDYRLQMAVSAYQRATTPANHWSAVSKQFEKLLPSLLS
ncbi:MAG: glycosyltransferase [Cyanobacteria bacterium P01_G01_bin.54]